MMRDTYTVRAPWDRDFYLGLLRTSQKHCDRFLLVVVDALSDYGVSVLKKLEPWLISRQKRSEWPGTQLLGSEKRDVYTFRLEEDACQILRESASTLADWQAPHLPEDLCFLRTDGSPWFTLIAHERDCFFSLAPFEVASVQNDLQMQLFRESDRY